MGRKKHALPLSAKRSVISGSATRFPLSRTAYGLLTAVLLAVFVTGGCAWMYDQKKEYGLVRVKRIKFKCEKKINQGMLLPVDIIYVTRFRMPREVISVGPNRWFDSLVRENWEEKQSLSLKGGDEKTVEINRLWLENSKFLIIFANYKDVNIPDQQQIILDETAKKHVNIVALSSAVVIEQKHHRCLFF